MRKVVKEHPNQMHFIEVPFHCPMCGKDHSMLVFEDDFNAIMNRRATGKTINEVVPNMPKEDREKFLSGYCDDCQKLIFGGE